MSDKEFVVTLTVKVPENKYAERHANENDIQYLIESLRDRPHFVDTHPLHNVLRDSIQVTRVVSVEG